MNACKAPFLYLNYISLEGRKYVQYFQTVHIRGGGT